MSVEPSREELLAIVARQAQEIADLREEQDHARRQQLATAEVLNAIGQSPFELNAVLATLVRNAAELCEAGPAQIFRRHGDIYRYAVSQILDPVYQAIEEKVRISPGRGTLVGRVAKERDVVHIIDAWADPDYEPREEVRIGNVRTMLGVPLMRNGEPIGVMVLGRNVVEPFTPWQIDLVSTFAAQAVVAIESMRLFDEARLQAAELERSLEELKAAQDSLVQARKLASLGRLVSGISHEFNTPIGNALTISTALQLESRQLVDAIATGTILRSGLERTARRLSEGTAMIFANLKRASELVESFRQISAEQRGATRCAFNLRPHLDETIRNHRVGRHRFVVECPDRLPILGYPTLVDRVVGNVIQNSCLHGFPAGEGGTVVVAAGLNDAGDLDIRVRDDGCGIAPDDLGRVCDPFFTTARGAGSVGLGLHVAHNLVAAMNGRLSVENHEAGGTLVTISLPVGQPEPARPDGQPTP